MITSKNKFFSNNKSFLSASILLAVLGNTSLLPSISFGMDEDKESLRKEAASSKKPISSEEQALLSLFQDPASAFSEKRAAFNKYNQYHYVDSEERMRTSIAFVSLVEGAELPLLERFDALRSVIVRPYNPLPAGMVALIKHVHTTLLSLISEDSDLSFETRVEQARAIIEYDKDPAEKAYSVLLRIGQNDKVPVEERLQALSTVVRSKVSHRAAAYKSFLALFGDERIFVPHRSYLQVVTSRLWDWDDRLPEDERDASTALIARVVQHPDYPLEDLQFDTGSMSFRYRISSKVVNAVLVQKLSTAYESLSKWKREEIVKYIFNEGTPASTEVLLGLIGNSQTVVPMSARIRFLAIDFLFDGRHRSTETQTQRERGSALLWDLTQQEAPSNENYYHMYHYMRIMENGAREHAGHVFPLLEALSQNTTLSMDNRQWCARSIINNADRYGFDKSRAIAVLRSFTEDDPTIPIEQRVRNLTELVRDKGLSADERQSATAKLLTIAKDPAVPHATRIQICIDMLRGYTNGQQDECLAVLLPLCESSEEMTAHTRREAAEQFFYHLPSAQNKEKGVEYRIRAFDVLLPMMEDPKALSLEDRFKLLSWLDMGSSDAQKERGLVVYRSIVESPAIPLESRISAAWAAASKAGSKFPTQRDQILNILLTLGEEETRPAAERVQIVRSFLSYDADDNRYGVTKAQQARARAIVKACFYKQLEEAERPEASSQQRFAVAKSILENNGGHGLGLRNASDDQKTRARVVLSAAYDQHLAYAEKEDTPVPEKFRVAASVLKRESWQTESVPNVARQQLRARKLASVYYEDQLTQGEKPQTSLEERFDIAKLILQGDYWQRDIATDAHKARARAILVSYYDGLLETAENAHASQDDHVKVIQTVLSNEEWRKEVVTDAQRERVRKLVSAYFDAQLAILDNTQASLEERLKAVETVLDTSVLGPEREGWGGNNEAYTEYRKAGLASDIQIAAARTHLLPLLAQWKQLSDSTSISFAYRVCAHGSLSQKAEACGHALMMWKANPSLGQYDVRQIKDLVLKYGTDAQKVQVHCISKGIPLSPELEAAVNARASTVLRYSERDIPDLVASLAQDWKKYGPVIQIVDQELSARKTSTGGLISLAPYTDVFKAIEGWINQYLVANERAAALKASKDVGSYDYLAQDHLSRVYTFMREFHPQEVDIWMEEFVQRSRQASADKSISYVQRCFEGLNGGIDAHIDAAFKAIATASQNDAAAGHSTELI